MSWLTGRLLVSQARLRLTELQMIKNRLSDREYFYRHGIKFNEALIKFQDRAIAQEVSRRLPTSAVWVRVQIIWDCGGQSGTEAEFFEYFGFSCKFSFHQLLHTHHHLSSGAGTTYQMVLDVPSGLSPTSPQEITKRIVTLWFPLRQSVSHSNSRCRQIFTKLKRRSSEAN
jgi:hypothetical protein